MGVACCGRNFGKPCKAVETECIAFLGNTSDTQLDVYQRQSHSSNNNNRSKPTAHYGPTPGPTGGIGGGGT